MEQIINKQHILNFLNYSFSQKEKLSLIDTIFTINSYELLGEDVPDKDAVTSYFNSLQTKEGTWNTGKEHYVPTTAQILMTYSRWNIVAPNSLEPFFSATDTWEKTVSHVKKYTSDNYWGGLWGYVACYASQKKDPPWKKEYLRELDELFDSWSQENHQRTHVVASLLQLGEPTPQLEELARVTIAQQKEDGSWESAHWDKPLPQTTNGILLLKVAQKQKGVDVAEAIGRAEGFVKRCYKEFQEEKSIYGGFATAPNELKPKPLETGMGVAALLSDDLYLQWLSV